MVEGEPRMIFLGPQHPGAPGNVAFKVWLKGEKVVKAELVPGFLHRGFEKMMENRWWEVNVVLSPRYCVEDPDNFELAYVLAVEDLFGVEAPEKAKVVRTIVAEMSRIQSHLFWLMHMGGATGARYIPAWAMAAREEILKWYDYVTGHRIYHHYMTPGGIRWNVPKDFKEVTLRTLNKVMPIVKDIEDAFVNNRILRARTEGVGVVKGYVAVQLNATGPTLRAAGIKYDVRKVDPYEAYGDVDFEVPTGTEGDSHDRIVVRIKEIYQSKHIIEQLVERVRPDDLEYRVKMPLLPPPSLPWPAVARHGEGMSRVEAARGEAMVHVVGIKDRKPYRVKLITPSMPLLTTVMDYIIEHEDVTIADLPIIVMSLDPCAPDIDR